MCTVHDAAAVIAKSNVFFTGFFFFLRYTVPLIDVTVRIVQFRFFPLNISMSNSIIHEIKKINNSPFQSKLTEITSKNLVFIYFFIQTLLVQYIFFHIRNYFFNKQLLAVFICNYYTRRFIILHSKEKKRKSLSYLMDLVVVCFQRQIPRILHCIIFKCDYEKYIPIKILSFICSFINQKTRSFRIPNNTRNILSCLVAV